MMADIEKVKKGLEQCLSGEGSRDCGKCPYLSEECMASLKEDALKLLGKRHEDIEMLGKILEREITKWPYVFSNYKKIVRCKDCKHFNDGKCWNVNKESPCRTLYFVNPDWFCADGEQKDE